MNAIHDALIRAVPNGNIAIVPSFRTSTMCPTCQEETWHVKKKATSSHSHPKDIRGFKYCPNCGCLHHRDGMATENIGKSAVYHPPCLNPTLTHSKLQHSVFYMPNQLPTEISSKEKKLEVVRRMIFFLSNATTRTTFSPFPLFMKCTNGCHSGRIFRVGSTIYFVL